MKLQNKKAIPSAWPFHNKTYDIYLKKMLVSKAIKRFFKTSIIENLKKS